MLNVQIQYQSNKSIYQQLYDQIASQIINRQLEADSMLPSIRITAKEFRVSVITVKKAWEMLERNGLIYTVTGKGSFVKQIDSKTIEAVRSDSIEEELRGVIALAKQLGLTRNEFSSLVLRIFDEK
ncbi:MAG: GntR family transcriptional regulator [Bacteroidales bacterium]|nr:GntR family transcriptional regulator [Bacteroidales bacterium]